MQFSEEARVFSEDGRGNRCDARRMEYCESHNSSAISFSGVGEARRTCEEVSARRDGVGGAFSTFFWD